MENQIVVVNTVQEIFNWIETHGGDAQRDWYPLPTRQDDPKHIYAVEMKNDGRLVEFDAPTEEIATAIWEKTFLI